MQPPSKLFTALLVGIDHATTAVLDDFITGCGIPARSAVDTPSQLESYLADSEGRIIFFGFARNRRTSSFIEALQKATADQANEIIIVSDVMDEVLLKLALQVRAFDVLTIPLDRGLLFNVFQRAYRQLSAHLRSRALQSYVAESLRVMSSISLSFGRSGRDPMPGASISLSSLTNDMVPWSPTQLAPHHATMPRVALLETFKQLAQTRRKKFGDVFSDPGWDIVLDLYQHHISDKAVSVTSACLAAAVPSSTAMRKIAQLEEGGFVQRVKDSKDGRRVLLDLTPSCKKQLDEYFMVVEGVVSDLQQVTNAGSRATRDADGPVLAAKR